jgi:aryl-alcohol dehydrogenase-like predicted oxidoreductase
MHKIPQTDILVSEQCLGTMNFGEQVSKEDAYSQLDLAFNKYGINFIDTSDMFPAPYRDESRYRSERILGRWMKERKIKRSDIIISTKIQGFDSTLYEDGEDPNIIYMNRFLNKEYFVEQVDFQLQRLGTDYIDILHFGSPDRYDKLPGDKGKHRIELENPFWTFETTRKQLEAIDHLIKVGKIRHYALTDETVFGLTHFATSAHWLNLPKPVLIQNSFNLLERNEFEMGLLEACQPTFCNVGLMAKSPLAGGMLTGKYLDRNIDLQARMFKFPGDWMGRYTLPSAMEATRKYRDICKEFSVPLTAVALSYVNSKEFVTSTVIGATSVEQLEDNILSLNIPITEELEAKLDAVYEENWDPIRGTIEYMDPSSDYTDPATLPWGSKDQDVDPELEELLTQGERHIQSNKNKGARAGA